MEAAAIRVRDKSCAYFFIDDWAPREVLPEKGICASIGSDMALDQGG
jgi:hypothetical protein